jgi:Gas vesicle synthesis protein GvpL/GvpF
MADALVYVYAVGESALADVEELGALAGVDGAAVRVVGSGALAAAVSSVDPTRFSEESLRKSLEDLHWLERVARAHHRVVDELRRRQPVVPVRLATIYVDDDNVRALLDANADRFAAALDLTRGRTEWGVKAFAVAGASDEPDPEADAGGPGTAYLMRKRAARDRAARARQRLVDAAEEVHARVGAIAVATRRYRPQDPRLSGRDEEMVLNAAYLVDDARSAELRRLVESWDAPQLRLELTGPWAPYSFAELEQP